jgi:hypothetical protein
MKDMFYYKYHKNKNLQYNYIMASVHNYTFNNLCRIGNDECGVSSRDMQNNNQNTYTTTNYFAHWGGMKKPIDLATSLPNINYTGGHGSVNGGNIKDESRLKLGTIQTHPKCRVSLRERPFATVPFLGRGPPRPVTESRIQQGAWMSELKSSKTITERNFNTNTPLIPSIAENIQNPVNLVEGVAAEGWIRGGLPSREITRNRDYIERCE